MKHVPFFCISLCLLALFAAGCDDSAKSGAPAVEKPALNATVPADAPKNEAATPSATPKDDTMPTDGVKGDDNAPAQAPEDGAPASKPDEAAAPDEKVAPDAPAAPAEQIGTTPTEQELLHRRFVLHSVDGVPFSALDRVPEIQFLEGFRVAGGICNRFNGQGKIEDGKLVVPAMASTKMLCADQYLNSLETLFGKSLTEGAVILLNGKQLTLHLGEQTLLFELKDLVQ